MNVGRPRRSEEQPDSPFGEAIKELLRQRKGFTQAMLAHQSMISSETLSRMIKGQRLTGHNMRVHLRNMIRAFCHFGVLHTLEEANDLLTKIPGVKELDRRDQDDQALIKELEEHGVRTALFDLQKQYRVQRAGNCQGGATLEDIAWSLYVELVTRISIQPLTSGQGLLREALNSLYALFQEARKILREGGSRIATHSEEPLGFLGIQLLNQGIRPFTAKWHPLLLAYEKTRPEEISAYEHEQLWVQAAEMRGELAHLQANLGIYAEDLARIIGIAHRK